MTVASHAASVAQAAQPPSASPSAQQRFVICMKWGKKYGPDYVNRLYAMVRRHLKGDFRLVCLTDDGVGIRDEVECLPIPPLNLPAAVPDRASIQLSTFSAVLHVRHCSA